MKAVLSKRGWKAKLAAALAAATIAAPLGVAAIAPLVPAVQAYADEAQGQRQLVQECRRLVPLRLLEGD